MTSKELLAIIKEEEEHEFNTIELYKKIFGEGSFHYAAQKGRWQSLYFLIEKLEEMGDQQ